MTSALRRALLAIGCALAFTAVSHAQTAPDDFTIVAVPDIQNYSEYYPNILFSQFDWIRDHIASDKIRLVIGLGDNVNRGGNDSMWSNASSAWRELDGLVPYAVAIGNNDYDQNWPAARKTTAFNRYFGPSRYYGKDWYQGSFPSGTNDNFYLVTEINGQQYLVLALEFNPRDSALAWADGVLDQYPNASVIITTHAFMTTDNTRLGKCDRNNADAYGMSADNDADEMWDKFVSRHANILMVLSGHIGDSGVGRRADAGVNGNVVNQMLSDFQTQTNGGNGFLRILRVKPSLNRVDVQTYSPYLDAYKTDSANQFSFALRESRSTTSGTGDVKGIVRATDCTLLPNAQITYSEGSSTAAANGTYSAANLNTGQRTLSVTLDGWQTQSLTTTVAAGLTAQLEFFLTKGTSPPPPPASGQGTVTGRVTSIHTGSPLANATISNGTASAVSDANGYFTMTMAPGSYTFTATLSGWLVRSQTITVTDGATTTANFQLSTAGIIKGTVTDAGGAVLPGVSIVAQGGAIATTKNLTTSSTGTYSTNWTSSGSYTLTYSKPGYATQTRTVTISAGQSAIVDVTMSP